MMNENALSNILVDVSFLENELKRIGRGHLTSVFVELRAVSGIFHSSSLSQTVTLSFR